MRRIRGDVERRRQLWQKEARVDRRPWRYLLAAQWVIGTSGWIVRVQDSETGEVLDERSAGVHQT